MRYDVVETFANGTQMKWCTDVDAATAAHAVLGALIQHGDQSPWSPVPGKVEVVAR